MNLILKKDKVLFFLFVIPVAILVGSRGATPDTQVYYNVFKYIDSFNLWDPKGFYQETGMEIGFGWYSWLVGSISNSSFILFFVFSLINFYFIYKTSEYLRLPSIYSLLFYLPSAYFFMQQFMQMRQGLAISMVVYSCIRLLNSRKDILPWLVLLISFFIHQTAGLVFLFAVIFYFFKDSFLFSTERIKWTLLLSFFIFVLFFKFFLLSLLVDSFARLQSYANTDNYSENIALFSLPNIRTMLVVAFLLFFSKENILIKNSYKFFLYLMIIALAARVGFSEFAIMSGRLSTAFSYVEIFALPILLLSRFNKGYCLLFAITYFILQIVITLGFQAPYLIEMYYYPLY
ncbi:EpsG family protein [Acinetobacter baumannii]|nr:EpsG family protein [Acinetobacter baumannii]